MSPLVAQAWLILMATGWKSYQLVRSRVELPIAAVTIALAAQTIGQGLPSLLGDHALIEVLGERGFRFANAAVLAIALLATSVFFQSSARAGTLTRRRLRIEIAVAALAVAAAGTAVFLQPAVLPGDGVDSASSSVADFSPGRIEYLYPYFLIINVYYVWASATASYHALKAARRARSFLRGGLFLAGLGLGILTAAVVTRLIAGAAVLLGQVGAVQVLSHIGTGIFLGLTIFFLGVAFPAAGTRARAGRVWLARRRMYRRLEALARRFQQLFPELTLRTVPSYSVLERAGLRHVARNFYRRVIEIHDALMQLSRYLPDDAAASNDPERQAGLVAEALRLHQAGHDRGDRAIDLGIAADTTSLDNDGRALVALSRALLQLVPPSLTAETAT